MVRVGLRVRVGVGVAAEISVKHQSALELALESGFELALSLGLGGSRVRAFGHIPTVHPFPVAAMGRKHSHTAEVYGGLGVCDGG